VRLTHEEQHTHTHTHVKRIVLEQDVAPLYVAGFPRTLGHSLVSDMRGSFLKTCFSAAINVLLLQRIYFFIKFRKI